MINSLLSAREFFEKTALFKLFHQTRIDEIFRLCRRHFGSSASYAVRVGSRHSFGGELARMPTLIGDREHNSLRSISGNPVRDNIEPHLALTV